MILFDTNNSAVIRLDNFITLPTNMSTVTMPTGCILVTITLTILIDEIPVICWIITSRCTTQLSLINAHQSYMKYSYWAHGEMHIMLD